MIGMPALALAMLSLLFLAYWHRQRKWVWLAALSSCCLRLSVLTKLFTGLLAPIFLIGLLLDEYSPKPEQPAKPGSRSCFPAVVWGVIFGLLGLVLGLALVGVDNIPQLLQSHLAASRSAPNLTGGVYARLVFATRDPDPDSGCWWARSCRSSARAGLRSIRWHGRVLAYLLAGGSHTGLGPPPVTHHHPGCACWQPSQFMRSSTARSWSNLIIKPLTLNLRQFIDRPVAGGIHGLLFPIPDERAVQLPQS